MSSKGLGNWKMLALNGVIAVLFGLIAMIVPDTTIQVIVMYFGIVILIIGLAMLWGAISNIRENLPYTVDMVSAIVTIIIGAVLTFYTQKSLVIFVSIVGAWAILVAIVQLYMATRSELLPVEKHTFLVNGLVSLFFGVLLFFYAYNSVKILMVIGGILSFIVGVILIYMSVKLKNIEKTIIQEVKKED